MAKPLAQSAAQAPLAQHRRQRARYRSISRRLSVMFALVSLCMFTLIGSGLFFVLRIQLDRHLRESLDHQMEVAHLIAFHGSSPDKWRIATEKLDEMTPSDGTSSFVVTSDDPRYRYGNVVESRLIRRWPSGYAHVRPTDGSADRLVLVRTVEPHNARPALQIQVSESYAPNIHTLQVFAIAIGVLSAAASIIVLWLSHLVARVGLAPLARLTRDAAQVSPRNRAQRLDAASLPRELDTLADTFNAALERLDNAYGHLESFNADVAHELRTPVTILIGQTQVALSKKCRSVDDLRVILQSNLEEYERMRQIINDMLFLARADQGERAAGLESVSLADEIARTLEYLEMPLDDAQVHAISNGDAKAWVNRSLFGRACTNLLINAIQHCHPNDTIDICISRRDALIDIAFSNPGEPIPHEIRSNLFDRFYRADISRQNSRENHGLGLAIVKAIASMHEGDVAAASIDGTNTFRFSVSAAKPSDSTDGRAQHSAGNRAMLR